MHHKFCRFKLYLILLCLLVSNSTDIVAVQIYINAYYCGNNQVTLKITTHRFLAETHLRKIGKKCLSLPKKRASSSSKRQNWLLKLWVQKSRVGIFRNIGSRWLSWADHFRIFVRQIATETFEKFSPHPFSVKSQIKSFVEQLKLQLINP